MRRLLLVSLFIFAGCRTAPAPLVKAPTAEKPVALAPTISLSDIDLTKIGRVAPKGRVQDTDYNHLPVVESLITHGNEAVPFLIGKLNDETKIKGHVFDYWYDVRVGDVAFVILTDFFTDRTWRNTTIPGVGYDTFLQRTNSEIMAEQVLRDYIAKHGRRDISNRWRQIWAQYKDRVYWHEHDRCFRLRDS